MVHLLFSFVTLFLQKSVFTVNVVVRSTCAVDATYPAIVLPLPIDQVLLGSGSLEDRKKKKIQNH